MRSRTPGPSSARIRALWWAALVHLRGCRRPCVAFVWVVHIAVRYKSCRRGSSGAIVRKCVVSKTFTSSNPALCRSPLVPGTGGEDPWGWVSPAARGIPSVPRLLRQQCQVSAACSAYRRYTRPATEPVKLRSCFETCTELILRPGHRWFARVYTTKHCNLCQQHQPCARCGSS